MVWLRKVVILMYRNRITEDVQVGWNSVDFYVMWVTPHAHTIVNTCPLKADKHRFNRFIKLLKKVADYEQ